MSDVFTPAIRSAIMRAVPSVGTTAEVNALALLLPRLGRRVIKLNERRLPGAPDIVIPSLRVALFVHGCFWHGHHCKRGCRVPRTRRKYWKAKIARNRARDRRNAHALRGLGWRVFHLWECKLQEAKVAAIAKRLLKGRAVGIER